MPVKISFCLITYNEEQNLPRCLESVRGLADQIVIVDSGSADRTERIARDFGAEWHSQAWLGFVGQKNFALSLARNQWVFSLDADEELGPELREEIQAIQRSEIEAGISGFSVPRMVYYERRWIRHGDWYPDRLVRLFRQDRARFAGGQVHERLEIAGQIRPLRGLLHHYSFRDAADHWARCAKYARLWAETQAQSGQRPKPGAALGHAAHRFIRAYVLRGGFLDGRLGFRIAAYAAREVYLKYKWWAELSRRD